MTMLKTALATALLASALTGAASAQKIDYRKLSGAIAIDGSSTVFPIIEAVAEAFSDATRDRVRVTVGVSGTGGGFKRFSIGETDISDASRPIKASEYKAAQEKGVEFIEIPVAYDGLSIVVNKANHWVDHLTIDELKKMFLDGSGAKTWKDIRSDWPDVKLSLYSPGTDSGTFDYFKEVIAGKGESIRSDMSVSEDDNVLVRGVSGDQGGLGFFGCAYYFENKDKLKVVPIVNPETSKAVTPTHDTIESGEYAPFSRPLFIYVNRRSADRPEVDAFVHFVFEKGPELAEEVGYVKLPAAIIDRARANFTARTVGTQFLDAKLEKVHGPLTKVYQKK